MRRSSCRHPVKKQRGGERVGQQQAPVDKLGNRVSRGNAAQRPDTYRAPACRRMMATRKGQSRIWVPAMQQQNDAGHTGTQRVRTLSQKLVANVTPAGATDERFHHRARIEKYGRRAKPLGGASHLILLSLRAVRRQEKSHVAYGGRAHKPTWGSSTCFQPAQRCIAWNDTMEPVDKLLKGADCRRRGQPAHRPRGNGQRLGHVGGHGFGRRRGAGKGRQFFARRDCDRPQHARHGRLPVPGETAGNGTTRRRPSC